MGIAAMMAVSMMGINASAYTNLYKSGANCTAYKSTSSSVYASTSSADGSSNSVSVTVTLYYKKNGVKYSTGSGNSGKTAVSTNCSTPSGGTFQSATIVHKYKSATVFTGSLV